MAVVIWFALISCEKSNENDHRERLVWCGVVWLYCARKFNHVLLFYTMNRENDRLRLLLTGPCILRVYVVPMILICT